MNNVLQCDKHGFPLVGKGEGGSGNLLERLDSFRQFLLILRLSGVIDLIVAVTAPTIEEKGRIAGVRIEQFGCQRKAFRAHSDHPAALFQRRFHLRRHPFTHRRHR
jgi:hypothetical protein